MATSVEEDPYSNEMLIQIAPIKTNKPTAANRRTYAPNANYGKASAILPDEPSGDQKARQHSTRVA